MVVIGCSSAQIVNKTAFTIKNAYVQQWLDTSGVDTGKLVVIEIQNSPEYIQFDSIFFDNKKRKPEVIKENDLVVLKAVFKHIPMHDKNLILHADPRKEFGNRPPVKKETTPFELAENECVISFIEKGSLKYYKTSVYLKE